MKDKSPRRGSSTARAAAVSQVKLIKFTASPTSFQAGNVVSAVRADRSSMRSVEPRKE
jgi:hypothetical protein